MTIETALLRATIVATLASPAFAANSIVPVAGTYVYSQNFDAMFAPATAGNVAASPGWTDNSTIANWWFYHAENAANAGLFAGTGFAYFGADGSAASNLTLNSQGTAGNADRAFAAPSTTARGEQSGIIVFQNNAVRAVDLTRIQYNGEVRRTNSGTNVESVFVWYRKAASQAAALTLTTAAVNTTVFPAAVSTTPTSYYVTGWTQVDAARWTYSNPATAAPVNETHPIDASGLTGIRINPGEFIALRFSNINDGGTDALLGIDDLNISFTEVAASVSTAVTNVVRNGNGTPANPADDTVDFRLTVTGTGAVGPTWTITTPASLATTAPYGIKDYAGIPIAEFSGALHQITATAQDSNTASVNETFTVTAPWCSLTASVSGFTYANNGTELDASDDVVSYLGTATGSYTGATYTVTGASAPASASYGNAASLTTTPGAVDSLTFTDGADASCTASVIVNHQGIIGTNSVVSPASPQMLLSQPVTGTRLWTLNSTTREATQTGVPANADHTILSQVLDLSSVGAVVVTATLDAIAGASSGFEAADHFQLDVSVDGGAPASILGASDTNGNGLLEGNAGTGTELPGATVVNMTKTFNFTGTVPASANSLQIRIVGNSNSGSETYVLKNLNVSIAPPGLLATAGAVLNNNHGTDSAADDTLDVPITITPVNLGTSTGWSSNLTAPDSPASGLYSTPNPVTFSLTPPVLPATNRMVTFSDNFDPSKMATVTIAPQTRTLTATVTTGTIVRQDNGPGLADDTVTFELMLTGANGGPHFTLTTDIGSVTTADYVTAATATAHTVTLSPAPEHGTVIVAVRDASYPSTSVNVAVAVPAPPVPATQYVLGRKDLGTGPSDVVTAAGTPSTAWYNYPGLRKTVNTNGGATAAVISAEVIDLSAINGSVQLTGTLRAVDRSSGFEAADAFKAELILDGNTAVPVNLITAYDANTSGLMNGGAGAADDEFNAVHFQDGNYTATFALSYLIPDSVGTVQLVITGNNDSNNETFIVEDVLFALSGAVDTDGDGMDDAYEIANGLDPNSAADKLLDRDSDGQNNYAEFLAGTGANDPFSSLKLISSNLNPATGAFSITWSSVPGKKYRVQASPAMLPGTWVDLTGDIPASAGSSTTLTGTLPGPLAARSFFNVRL